MWRNGREVRQYAPLRSAALPYGSSSRRARSRLRFAWRHAHRREPLCMREHGTVPAPVTRWATLKTGFLTCVPQLPGKAPLLYGIESLTI